tara:strand:+ start:3799 stop:4293 length:495 start_codon:yes stop_codon:yes gene_type:complete
MKKSYRFMVPCSYLYEVQAYSEHEARKKLIKEGGITIIGTTCIERDDYFNAELVDEEELGYPYQEGDTYYTIEQAGDVFGVVESVWDDVSQEMHDENPNRPYFRNKGNAWLGVKLIKMINSHDKYYKRSEDWKVYEKGTAQKNAIRTLALDLGEPGQKIIDKYL